MYEINSILEELCGAALGLSGEDETAAWLISFIRASYKSMACYTVIPLSLLAAKMSVRRDVGEAFALFWERGEFEDPTIIAPAILASVHHLGEEIAQRLKDAFGNQRFAQMSSPEIAVAAFASALARLGCEEYAVALVTGYQVHGAGIPCEDVFAAMALSLEASGDSGRLRRFVDAFGFRCYGIDPVTAAYLRRHAISLGGEHYGTSFEINLNTVCFVATISANSVFESFALGLFESAALVSENPPLHRVPYSSL